MYNLTKQTTGVRPMKKPSNWRTLRSHELLEHIDALNRWNANQPISNAAHNKHYNDEIQPLVDLKRRINDHWIKTGEWLINEC
jgi:hypothetical protein